MDDRTVEYMAEVVRNALENYAHGRRAFALQQLETLVGEHGYASDAEKWWLTRCLKVKDHDSI